MATINFFLRGSKEPKTIYFRYRPSDQLDLRRPTPFLIESDHWDSEQQNWNTKEIVNKAKRAETKQQNAQIEKFNADLAEFSNSVCAHIDNSRSLKANQLNKSIIDFVESRYFGHKVKTETKHRKPEIMSDLIDFYIDFRSVEDNTQDKKPLAGKTIDKYITLKNLLNKFSPKLKVTEINDVFRNDFIKYLNKQQYAVSTQVNFIKDIKMFCKFADDEHSINKNVLYWKVNSNPDPVADGLFFTLEKLETLKTKIMPTEKLDNARDWLLISCYTSVRVSELFAFDEKNIIDDNGSKFIMVQESKNRNNKDKGMKCIYLLPEVVAILNKRGGKFPRKISEQNYNKYLKEVCEKAGFDEMVSGAIRIKNSDGKIRKVKGVFPFHKMVSSHIGRITYVTLFSRYLPDEVIQMQTNHHSKEMVNHYNKTELEDKLLQRAKVVAKAHSEVKLKIV